MALSERGRFLPPQTPARYSSIKPCRTRQPGRDLYLPPVPQGGFFGDDERSLIPTEWKGGKAIGQDPGGNPRRNPAPAAREGKNRGRESRRPLLENSTQLEALLYISLQGYLIRSIYTSLVSAESAENRFQNSIVQARERSGDPAAEADEIGGTVGVPHFDDVGLAEKPAEDRLIPHILPRHGD